ncbi:hypothetical protein OOK27_24975 [Streptomyces canus]|uniref:hypothetical protein n=1 Tax=Streptomyces canus TaxID=58343 RepID=UPI0022562F07|nr:hypothetical protein [Streptomyces canus]MCX5257336.1 hypothetical protein [Streptomyces canus]
MQAVAREFAWSDVVPDIAGLYTVGQQVLDHAVESLLCLVDLAVAVQERRHVAVMVLPGRAGDEGERPQHRFQACSGTFGEVPDCGQVVEVEADLSSLWASSRCTPSMAAAGSWEGDGSVGPWCDCPWSPRCRRERSWEERLAELLAQVAAVLRRNPAGRTPT